MQEAKMDQEKKYDYDFIMELENNNAELLNLLKNKDPESYDLPEKTKMNILFLTLKKNQELADKLARQYRKVIIKAYSYFYKEINK